MFTVSSAARGCAALCILLALSEPASAGGTDETRQYTWILVFASFFAWLAAYGIGANDVANAYATSVGAKSITIKQAVGLAAVFEFLGAVTFGSSVSDTIRKKIADPTCFEDNPGLLMWGMFCVIIAVGIWLLVASWLEMPVSTTHSCVGGVVGMTMMSRGSDCVVWNEPIPQDDCTFDTFPCVKGVSAIVVSWLLSPIASGVCAAILYFVTYQVVLKNTEQSFFRAKIAFPIIVGFTVGINVMFFVLKGSKSKAEDLGTDDIVAEAKEGNLGPVAVVGVIAMAIAAGVTAFITPMLVARIKLPEDDKPKDAEANPAQGGNVNVEVDPETKEGSGEEVTAFTSVETVDKALTYVSQELVADAHRVLKTDNTAAGIHSRVQLHDARCEEMFKYVQVFTAIVDSFSHGANDVANAMGPFAAIYATYKTGAVSSKYDMGDEMYWILAIGGFGIVVGLATYGYKIISAIGVKLTAITPSRGYCIELGAAFVIIYGTSKGWPLSTTHCQVGATVGVGLFEGTAGVNPVVLMKCVFGWIITLVVVGTTAALLVGPSPEPIKDSYCDYSNYDYSQYYDENVTAFIASQ